MSVFDAVFGQTNQASTSVRLETTECVACGTVFAMPVAMLDERRNNGKTFYCPNGHHLTFGDTKEDRLKQELERERNRSARKTAEADQLRADRDATRRQLSAQRGVTTRMKNRIARGICPCCNRHFDDLQAHMETKHPGYTNSES